MREKTIKIYKFEELPTERAKEKAHEWFREASAQDSYWAEHPTEEFADVLRALGFTLNSTHRVAHRDAIYWSLNPACASFSGAWRASAMDNEMLTALRADRPLDTKLHEAIDGFRALAAKYPDASGEVNTSRGTSPITEFDNAEGDSTPDTFDELVTDLCHEFACVIDREYEYQNSDEQIDEAMIANEYEFNEDGSIYR